MRLNRSARENTFREPKLPIDLTDQLRERLLALQSSVKADYLKAEVFSKFVSDETDPPETKRARAIFKWLCTERNNEATNERLLFTPEEYNILPRVTFERFVQVCRDIIVDIIGETPPVEALIGAFSGGASTSRPRTTSFAAGKYFGKAHVTEGCLDLFCDVVVGECPGWLNAQSSLDLRVQVVPGNVMFTVPKKPDIDRVACKEPDLNMFIQKGIGRYLGNCLRSVGITLRDQSKNRNLARIGSQTGELATLDLSSASDSVTTGLVSLLLPECWHTLLDTVRCQVTVIDGDEHQNQMFSSMGNGFTFELESLLFYSLMKATAYLRGVPGVISVYGDDLIIPTELASYGEWVLNYFGFEVNPDKSFVDGPFRESCGGHYWNGVDITPFYVKEPIKRLVHVIKVANKLRKWGDLKIGTERMSSVIDHEVESIWLWLKSFIPSYLWGGVDLNQIYQLVSNDPSKRYLEEESKSKNTGSGGYPHWLNSTWARMELNDPVRLSSRTVSLGRMRLRSIRESTVPQLEAYFLHEIC